MDEAGLALALRWRWSPRRRARRSSIRLGRRSRSSRRCDERDGDKAIAAARAAGPTRRQLPRRQGRDRAAHRDRAPRRSTGSASCSARAPIPNIGDAQRRHAADHRRPRSASTKPSTSCCSSGQGRRGQPLGETALIVAVQQRQPRDRQAAARSRRQSRQGRPCRRLFGARLCQARHAQSARCCKLIETVKSTKKPVAGPSLN